MFQRYRLPILIATLFLMGVTAAFGSEKCIVNRPIASTSVEKFRELEACGLMEIKARNNLSGEELQNLVVQAAVVFPRSQFILKVAREFQENDRPLIMINFTKPLEKFELTLELGVVHFDRKIRFSEIETSYDEIEKIIGSLNTTKLFNELLNSKNMIVAANAADSIAYASSEMGDLKTKALQTLISHAGEGHMESLEVLTWVKDYFSKLEPEVFYQLVRLHQPKEFDTSTAGIVIGHMRYVSYQEINKEWFRELFLHAASGDPATNTLARQMYEITEDRRFDVKYEYEISSSSSKFRRCSLNPKQTVFSCYDLYSEKEDDVGRFTYHLINVALLLENFDLDYKSEISKNLIDSFFSRDIPYNLKNEFSTSFFIGVGLTNKHISPKTQRVFRSIKADINRYMWSNHAEEIVTDNENNFPLTDEIASVKSQAVISAYNSDFSRSQHHSYINDALPHIAKATSSKFFSDLSMAIYGLYAHRSGEELEDLIDLALLRTEKVFGKRNDLYFDFAYHKNLVVQATGTLDRVSFLIENINEMKNAGLDTRLFESELLEAYIKAGKMQFALKKLSRELQRIDALEASLTFASKDQKSIRHLTVDSARCTAVVQIRKINEKVNGSRDLSDEIKHCFNNFSYPSRVPFLVQQELFAEYIGMNSEDFLSHNEELISRGVVKYIKELLEDQSVAKWQKVPFAFVAINSTEDKIMQEKIWKTHFASSVLKDYPAVMKKQSTPYFTWLREYSKSLVFGESIEATKSLLSLLETSSKPDLNSPIASLDSEARSMAYTARDTKKLFNLIKSDTKDVQRLFVAHQNLKFGPSEQLLLRGSLLSDKQRSRLQSKLTKRALTVEKILGQTSENAQIEDLHKKLKAQNKDLRTFSFPEFEWSEIYPNLENLQKTIGLSDLYLDFRHDKSGNAIGLFQITNNTIEYHVISDANKIARLSNVFRSKTLKGELTFHKEGKELYLKIIEPFLKPQTKKIMISPHSFLFNIPFNALVIEAKKQKPTSIVQGSITRGVELKNKSSVLETKNDYLGNSFEITLVSTMVRSKPKKNVSDYTFFGIGNPNFKGTKKKLELAFNDYQSLPNRAGAKPSSLHPLPNTQIEIETFAKLPIFTSAQLLTGSAATEKAVYEADKLKNASVISFATHGLIAGEIDEYSEPGLALSPPEIKQNKNDGFLSLTDVLNLKLNSEIVILSACNTGSSLSLHSPPFSGLASAFLAAGSDMVLATLWSVDDKATTIFLSMIGEEKTRTNTWSEAHQKAIPKFISLNPRYAHPRFWAPFTIFTGLDE